MNISLSPVITGNEMRFIVNWGADPRDLDSHLRTPENEDNDRNPITSWNWNFGDGQTSTQQNPSHIYTSNGDYTVSLTVGDGSSTNLEIKVDYIKVGPYSIEEIISESIDLYPNPAYGLVQFKSEYKIQQIKIYNYSGKLIKDLFVNDYSIQLMLIIWNQVYT